MRTSMAFASVVLVAACGVALTQPIPTPPPVTPPAPVPSPPVAPPPPTLDQLLDQLEQVQAQKAELAKREEMLKQIIRKKLDEQAERLKKVGVRPGEAEPDRVGRVVLQGFAEKDEKKVRDALGICPGQLLQYPALEEARTKLAKAGFRGATVEVLPNGEDSRFKDIRVRSAAELDR